MRAILHIDGDSFFASCEVAKNPSLRGKVVITGKERGIVSACTYEGKSLGIKRGMRLFEVKKICPDAVILPSDYETYSIFSERMYNIVRRYTPDVEEYSIDECFADLTGMRRSLRMSYPEIADKIKMDLDNELGMTFSIGVSCTKTLAKIGSKWKKPSGLTLIPLRDASQFLSKITVDKVWGIGPNTTAYLNKFGIKTAQDFVTRDEVWIRSHLSKPFIETWMELRGEVVNELNVERRHTYHSISKTKTFTPPSTDPSFIFAQLSKNVENACIKARRWNLVAPRVVFFLKTQDFQYHSCEVRLPNATNIPHEILNEIKKYASKILKRGIEYRATGIVLCELCENTSSQMDLFGSVQKSEAHAKVFKSIDEIAEKYGKHAVFLGSSFQAMKFSSHVGERGDVAQRVKNLFNGETARRRLAIPMLGEAS